MKENGPPGQLFLNTRTSDRGPASLTRTLAPPPLRVKGLFDRTRDVIRKLLEEAEDVQRDVL